MAVAERLIGPLLLLAATAAGGGCASHPQKWIGLRADLEALRATVKVPTALRDHPLPVVAISSTIEPAVAAPKGALTFDTAIVADELARIFEATGAFTKVIPIETGAKGHDLVLEKEKACAAGASILLETTILEPTLRKRDCEYVLPVALWMTLGFPSLWIQTHTFEFSAGLRVRVHGLATGQVLPERQLQQARKEETLNFHERIGVFWPFYFLTYIFPTPLFPTDDDRPARLLAASALRAPVGQFLSMLEDTLHGDIYKFHDDPVRGGPEIEIAYPPLRQNVYVFSKNERFSVVVDAGDSALREVWVQGERAFPVKSQPGTVGDRRIQIEDNLDLRSGATWVVTAVDAAGRKSTCTIRAERVGGPVESAPVESAPASPKKHAESIEIQDRRR